MASNWCQKCKENLLGDVRAPEGGLTDVRILLDFRGDDKSDRDRSDRRIYEYCPRGGLIYIFAAVVD